MHINVKRKILAALVLAGAMTLTACGSLPTDIVSSVASNLTESPTSASTVTSTEVSANESAAAEEANDIAGKYVLFQYGTDDNAIGYELFGLIGMGGDYLNLNADGTGKMQLYNAETDVTWNADGTIDAGANMIYSYKKKDGVLRLDFYDTYYFFVPENTDFTTVSLPDFSEGENVAVNAGDNTGSSAASGADSESGSGEIDPAGFNQASGSVSGYANDLPYYYSYDCETEPEADRNAPLATNLKWEYSGGVIRVSGDGAIENFEKGAGNQPWKKYKKQATELIIEEGITRVGDRAFQGYENIKKVTIASSVESIGMWTFQNDYALETVDMPEDIILETGAFRSTPAERKMAEKESDYYTSSPFYPRLCAVELIGDFREDMMKIAASQIGYHEGNCKADICGLNAAGNDDYTEFGRYHESMGDPWCSEFASWCARMTGVPFSRLNTSRGANAYTFTNETTAHYYDWSDTVYGGGSYTPQAGDILLWKFGTDSYTYEDSLSHTSILKGVTDRGNGTVVFHVIEGNTEDSVVEDDYNLDKYTGSIQDWTGHLGYIVSPDYESHNDEATLSFDAAGGKVKITEKTIFAGGLYGPLPIPEKQGSTFDGWYTAETDGERITMYTEVVDRGDQTLYAHWK